MKKGLSRRRFLATSAAAAAAGVLGGREVQGQAPAAGSMQKRANRSGSAQSSFSRYSRYHPSFGGPPESDHYLGKLVPRLRKSGLPPVPFEAPDLGKIPWRMVDGAKEFEIRCTPVKREFLPGRFMTVWGYNGSLPGPTIEAFQGDRVRFVVHNELPEPTTVYWHGLELPV